MRQGNDIVARNETLAWAYVAVESFTDWDGQVEPRAIFWSDGRRFEIDQVLDCKRAYGDERERWWYLVRIGNQYRELWWDNPSWHVLVPPGRGGERPHARSRPPKR